MMSYIEQLKPVDSLPYIIGGGIVGVTLSLVYLRSRKQKSHLVDAPEGLVVLRQFPRGPHAPNMSPFPIKLETYLRMANIPYRNIFGNKMSPRTGKAPWIQFNGDILSDSQFIIEHLNKHFGIDTMSHLSCSERAAARAFLKLVEESLHWCIGRWRFGEDPSNFTYKALGYSPFVFMMVRRYVTKMLYAQGIGRLQFDEVVLMSRRDIQAVSHYLGDKKFLMGDKSCEVDCAIFGILAQLKWHAPGSPYEAIMNEYPNLHAYCDRMKEAFWPDWDDCITHGFTKEATK